MQKVKDFITQNYLLLILLAVTIWLRFVNLGYSDYQGDEIKALFSPSTGQDVWEYLLDQRKGPVQFLITYVLSIFDPQYASQFLFRFPFALAGVFAVIVFYNLVHLHFGKKVAMYSAFLFSVNGLLIAFSRIVQYQSVTILFALLTLYFFSLALKDKKWEINGIYLGMITWAISILTHFDGGFIAPFAAYIIFRWFKNSPLSIKVKFAHMFTAGVMFLILISSFFVPYFTSLSDSTKGYWLDRLGGGYGRASSSQLTFRVYNPLWMFPLFCFFVVASLPKIRSTWAIIVWMAFPLIIWEFFTQIPGTHIYNYLIPLFILAAFGMVFIEEILGKFYLLKYLKLVYKASLVCIFIFWFALSNQVFVDNKVEYPWEPERFLKWTLPIPDQNYHLSLFGFPYYRAWEEIAAFVNTKNNGFYSTNERVSIARFYISLAKSTDRAGHYITVLNPQSYSPNQLNAKAIYWAAKYPPEKIITHNGREIVRIYYMPAGNLDVLTLSGY